ncbi:undecaprenyl-phosphate 4-deoxy-4-formamido-L-ara binose transferase [Desulfonema ishimotonii]|uniref:Undecaprenyl-phosphate 4-deoxy-4-formamido-L-ara binose transferase n=1 Tax=Desulfonema ishimotonii TaxID=45657 RepID=A0A401FSZ9_9BACT|nr:glycosyltransferase [Desulfonema ishimotonii]GBC60091.1 undecaprenyl-phosphate 4-deoxy-4-formamido-L-ara binose transferase [Desulfonema ishimotonii]
MDKSPYLSVVIPVYNEAASLDELIRRCLAACGKTEKSFEIILVDDGSADPSAEIIAGAANRNRGRIIGVFLNRNYGQHAAVMAGFEASAGDVVVTLDADLQNPPEEIPRLVRKAAKGADVVGSIRANRCDTLFRRLASSLINKWVQKSTGVAMHDYGCMLRAYRRHIVDAMLQCHERSTFIPVLANTFARHTAEIEVGHQARCNGDSKYGLWQLISLQFDLMTCMTAFPLRLLSIFGGIVSGLGLMLAGYILVMRLIHGDVWAADGVFTLFAVLFVFIGAQFVGMGLMGEYIGRIYNDVRARPRYFVRQIVGRKEPADRRPCVQTLRSAKNNKAHLKAL